MSTRDPRFVGIGFALAIAAALTSHVSLAADSSPADPAVADTGAASGSDSNPAGARQVRGDSSEKSTETLDTVVVTGSASGEGVKKIDASYTITSASLAEMKEANPLSVADLLRISPGVYPASSGGPTGANIQVVGYPTGANAPYVTLQMMGSPIYGESSVAWMENSSMIRLDDTIERIELLQGGPSVLYGDGQVGLTGNFILRQGTEKPSGDIRLTYGSEGLWRVDGFYGFKITDGWYASVGGFYRRSDGIRDPQFLADDGGQFTATLTHDLDRGSFMLYFRDTEDKNEWTVDYPFLNPSRGRFTAYPGFDPLTAAIGSREIQHQTLEVYPCSTPGCKPGGINVNLADGRGTQLRFFGGNFDYRFDNGLSVLDKFNFTDGRIPITSMLNSSLAPESLSKFVTDNAPQPGLTYTARYLDGTAADPNQPIMTQGLWWIRKEVRSFNNELRLSKELFEGNTLTFGNYYAWYTDNDIWYLGQNMLLQVKNNPRPITVDYNGGGQTWNLTDSHGFVSGAGSVFATKRDSRDTNVAFFLSDSWRVDRWLFDAGTRVEHQTIDGRVSNGVAQDLDNNPYTLYNNDAQPLTGPYTSFHYDHTASPSWTAGANYRINDNMSAYVRINNGYHFPNMDDIAGNPKTPMQTIKNREIGFKYQTGWLYADINAYHRTFGGVSQLVVLESGPVTNLYGDKSTGVNVNATITPFPNIHLLDHFSLNLNGYYMHSAYTDVTCVPGRPCAEGRPLATIPPEVARVTPAYDVPFSWGSVRLWVTYFYSGEVNSDLTGSQPLGHYHTFDMGAVATLGNHWEFRVQGTNMTNEIGVTEGNTRTQSAFASEAVLARSIEGREVNVQVRYKL